ncbi:MAG: hypothetical protein P8Y67_00045 [Alphaproteobacteria bacterium]
MPYRQVRPWLPLSPKRPKSGFPQTATTFCTMQTAIIAAGDIIQTMNAMITATITKTKTPVTIARTMTGR